MNRLFAHRLFSLAAAVFLFAVGEAASAEPADADTNAAERQPHLLWSARAPSTSLMPVAQLSLFERLDGVGQTAPVASRRPDWFAGLFAGFDGVPPSLATSASVPWCADASGLLRIGSLGQQCLMRGLLQFELPGQIETSELALGVNGQRLDLVLGFGLARLKPLGDEFGFDRAPWPFGSDALLPGYQPLARANGEASGLTLGGQWRLTAASALQFHAAINRLRLQSPGALGLLDVERSDLRLGLVRGSLAGQINAHTQRSLDLTGSGSTGFQGVDIGLSWRTPWRAELSLGAENVLSNGRPVLLPNPPRNNPIDNSAVRTPYVRYKQDL